MNFICIKGKDTIWNAFGLKSQLIFWCSHFDENWGSIPVRSHKKAGIYV